MNANPTKDLRADGFAFKEGACISDILTAPVKEVVREAAVPGESGTSNRNTTMRAAEAPVPQAGDHD